MFSTDNARFLRRLGFLLHFVNSEANVAFAASISDGLMLECGGKTKADVDSKLIDRRLRAALVILGATTVAAPQP